MNRGRWVGLICIAALVCGFLPVRTLAASPSLYLSPSAGPPGTQIGIQSQGWQGGHRIEVSFWKPTGSREMVVTIGAGWDGAFNTTEGVPIDATPKTLHIVARDLDSGAEFNWPDIFTITPSGSGVNNTQNGGYGTATTNSRTPGSSVASTSGGTSATTTNTNAPTTPTFYCIGGVSSLCNLPKPSPHHYIVFLDGITTHASVDDNPYLTGEFGDIKAMLMNSGFQSSQFVYFSYAGARRTQQGGQPCEGWSGGCKTDYQPGPNDKYVSNPNKVINNINATPIYTAEDTKIDLRLQREVLHWLIFQILVKDQSQDTQIDLIGFSLGGVVASYWAATYDRTELGVGPAIHSLILLESPVGGIYAATQALQDTNFLDGYILNWFGATVLTQLQVITDRSTTSGSIIPLLSRAAQNYPVTAIENTRDYFVSGQPLPNVLTPVVIGSGVSSWPGQGLQYHVADLGGGQFYNTWWTVAKENHTQPPHNPQTAIWVAQAVATP